MKKNYKQIELFTTITEKSKNECGNNDGLYDGVWKILVLDYRNQTVDITNGRILLNKKFDEINEIFEGDNN